MKNKYIYIILTVATTLILLIPPTTDAQVPLMSDYTAYPPFVTSSVAPNILLVLDHSGSMQFPAFHDCASFGGYSAKRADCGSKTTTNDPDRIYNPTHDYYGYFDKDKYYTYSSNKFIETSACSFTSSDPGYRVGNSSSCISGNMLNWATMSRIDLLRKALIGGKSVSTQGNAHTLRGEGGWWTYSDHTTGCTFTVDGGSYPATDHKLSISDYASSGMLSVRATGNQIWGTSDGFRYVYQSVTGDFDIRLRVISPPHEAEETYAKGGLMVRASTNANSQHVKAMATFGAGLQFSQRATDGASTTIIGSYVSTSYPKWVRIARTGNTFTYYYSDDGSTWTTHGNSTVALPATVLVGMASSSYSTTLLGTSEYDEFVCASSACTDDDFGDGTINAVWTAVDINAGVAGSQSESTNTCAVGSLSSVNINVDVPSATKSGIIQDIADTDGDGDWDADAPRFGLMVYAGDNRYGCVQTGIAGSNMSSLLTALQSEPAYHGTPTGEAFNEAWDYYIQNNAHGGGCNNNAYIGGVGSIKDPWCDSGGDAVSCRKSYVLHISDGEWNGSVDPVIPARDSHVNDIRTDPGMDGTQSLIFYNVYTFGDAAAGVNAMQQASLYGAFDDYDNNSWPYNRTGYPASSKTATMPAAPCPASSTDGNCNEFDKNGDGLPDTFYLASDGDALEAALVEAITDILKHASSGTAVSVLATTGEGEGAIYQA
jgi:regulation of enolase protein 1 (concanavalin A-like superfamily)